MIPNLFCNLFGTCGVHVVSSVVVVTLVVVPYYAGMYCCSPIGRAFVSAIIDRNINDHIHLIFPHDPLAARTISRPSKKCVSVDSRS